MATVKLKGGKTRDSGHLEAQCAPLGREGTPRVAGRDAAAAPAIVSFLLALGPAAICTSQPGHEETSDNQVGW